MPAQCGTALAQSWARRLIVMGTQWRSIPGRVILTALALLAVASFTGLLARPAAGVPILPAEVESPINRGPGDLGASR